MLNRQFTDDARAILLLCGHFGKSDEQSAPLKIREYNTLAEWLVSNELRPGDLLQEEGRMQLRDGILPLDLSRVEQLLERGVAMSLDTEKWMNKGIWVICRSDDEYPARLRTHLKSQAPPFLYAVGNPALLEGGGLAVVGSRDVQADGERFTRRAARRCAEHGIPVVSGGARGVDQAAMLEALQAEGRCIGVLADSLSRAAVDAKYRAHLRDGRLLLCSPYRPDAGFKAGMAMGRNKLVYAMAEHALVIQADKDKGGTWTGAKEELKRPQPRPVFVRIEEPVPAGNRALLALGALPFPASFFEQSPRDALDDAAYSRQDTATGSSDIVHAAEPSPSESYTATTPEAGTQAKAAASDSDSFSPSATALDVLRPLLLSKLVGEQTPDDLAKMLDVKKTQLDAWLKELVKEKAVRKLTRPVRYVRSAQIEMGSKKGKE